MMNQSTQNSSTSLRNEGQTVSFGQRKIWDNDRDLQDVIKLLDREYKDVIPFSDIESRMLEWNFIPKDHIIEACDTLKSLCDSKGNINLHMLIDQLTGFPEASGKDDMDANIDTLEAYKTFDQHNKGCIDLDGLKRVCDEIGEELDDDTLIEMLNLATKDVFRKKQNVISRDDFFSLVKSKVLN